MKKIIVILSAVILTISCKKEEVKVYTEAEIAQESKKAFDFFEEKFNEELERYPTFQTYLGIKKNNDKWDDSSDEFAEAELEIYKNTLQVLKDSINVDALDVNNKLSYDLFKQQLEDNIDDFKYRKHSYPVNQMFGAQSRRPAFLINMHRIDNVKDAETYIARLNGFKGMFNQLIDNLKSREEMGVMPPKFVFARVIEDSKNILVGAPFDKSNTNSTLAKDFASKVNKLDIDAAKKNKLINAANEALINSVKPAYESLIATLEAQQKVATTDDGAWKLPDGVAYYNNQLKRITTTDYTADEIHEIGLNEVARIHDEMRKIKTAVGFEGDLQEFFKFMKVDKQFYYEDSNQGRAAYMKLATHIIDSMKTRLDELFITKPKADIVVKAVEAFREKSAGKAFYQSPAPDGSRPGTYYANLYDMAAMPTYEMEALAYHEGIPGHHMQRSISQELTEIPTFRKYASYTAYTEGWGLYSEFIPKEMGFYSDPYSDFGRLAMELFRACRLVVDTGIHAKKWTREDGIKYYTDNTPTAQSGIVKMVERHIVMPGQATAYKIGMLKILELREKAKTALGDKFDIRKFHEVVLTNGAIPLNVLESKVDAMIEAEK
ncbi:DUF885 domain-containing protein [Urechidicola croceus]|uniref:DUF885 domain-containing protein n=1 Tax=Urechidicola croceus TaxID=1850246 RepID=A0A1D8P6J3_9FLAO|nr:DUF885 domain-containing protein [Urechidicola croceus]AOW20179.1 hypothetical protein LPB138_05565 [Urechidicola croceus]